MYRTLQQNLIARIEATVERKYNVKLSQIVVEQPPNIEFGEIALPLAFELAKTLRKAPRIIAADLAAEFTALEGVASVEVAGAGYLNVRLDRGAIVKRIAADEHANIGGPGFRLVEHTSINPNKAAHVGHLRNAILGDTFQRLLRPDDWKTGYEVGVQNYIDNTGVQVADVVLGLTHLEGKSLAQVEQLLNEMQGTKQRIDYYLWDLYARVSQWYTADPAEAPARKQLRLETLHRLEAGNNDTAEIADRVVTAVLHRHIETMARLGIEYDFLPRESEILYLHFWDAARSLMIERGVLYEETKGKNKGCWVMRRAGQSVKNDVSVTSDGPDEDAKVIVRSNGTVTYVGKDIAYHLWKFGLLPGKDFGYRKFHEYATHTCWISSVDGEQPHPFFGKADTIYNVIDSRQNDPQNNVIEALRGMGFTEAADHYIHFSYEMVALTPRCAVELGYVLSEEDALRSYIEVSGRRGFGVKADDLLDRLIAAARLEVDARNEGLENDERQAIAQAIAVGALRYFMLKFTRNTVIAFDFHDALSFEGETGPYVQYAVVRAGNIFRKAAADEQEMLQWASTADLARFFEGEDGASLWKLWLMASRFSQIVELSISSAEPAHLARYAFQLAQAFNYFYHRHHVLNETDEDRRRMLLATTAVARRELTRALGLLGIAVPSAM